jgi:hypothetical protein
MGDVGVPRVLDSPLAGPARRHLAEPMMDRLPFLPTRMARSRQRLAVIGPPRG